MAKHAIELDPENGEAWSVLGQIAFNSEWDWKTAEYDLQRAIALSPSDSTTELRYATFLSIVGRHDEAVSHMRRALELDPMSFFNVRHMGTVLYWARRYDESLQYLRRAQEMESDLIGFATYWSSQDYEMKGMHDQAVLAELQNAPSFDPMHWHDRLEKAYREGGPQASWKASIRRSQASPHTACSGFEIASFHARIGDKEGTITDLRQALEERCFLVATLNADPLFDGFRSDPRFKDMLKQLNLGE
jgi:tetratricopeptide (TPR) repeat protein